MKKRCEKCGKEFEARQPHFRLCSSCIQPVKSESSLSAELLLQSYHDSKGNFLKEVYINTPPKLANILFNSKPSLGLKQLRDFHQRILKAKTKAMLRGIDAARFILYECRTDLEYQLKRGVVPETFGAFMRHHLALAEKDERSLEGFFKHLDSVVCYFPIKK
jgi:CRISPR/Cas system CSM-associated protein Csm2 small subunit